jgi:hypothetical protein
LLTATIKTEKKQKAGRQNAANVQGPRCNRGQVADAGFADGDDVGNLFAQIGRAGDPESG